MNEKEFDYGIVVYKHRFNMTRPLDDYKERSTKNINILADVCLRTDHPTEKGSDE